MKEYRIIPNYGDSNFITGMRAFAALAVFLIHIGGGGLRDLGLYWQSVVDMGKTGVYAFFVISGFSVSYSLSRSKNYLDFFIKRMMRLAPPYYFFLVLTFFCGVTSTWGSELGIERSFYSYFMHFSFLSTFDYRVANNILGVEWSLAIEVFWYLLIPFMVRYIGSWKKNLILIILMLLLYKSSRTVFNALPIEHPDLAFLWTPFRYGLCFLLGIFAYKYRPAFQTRCAPWAKNLLTFFLLLAFFFYFYRPFAKDIYWISIFSFLMIMLGGNGNLFSRVIFENKLSLYIGAISYSFYLVHYPIIFWGEKYELLSPDRTIALFQSLAATLVVSTMTYLLIEKNSMKLTKRVIAFVEKFRGCEKTPPHF